MAKVRFYNKRDQERRDWLMAHPEVWEYRHYELVTVMRDAGLYSETSLWRDLRPKRLIAGLRHKKPK